MASSSQDTLPCENNHFWPCENNNCSDCKKLTQSSLAELSLDEYTTISLKFHQSVKSSADLPFHSTFLHKCPKELFQMIFGTRRWDPLKIVAPSGCGKTTFGNAWCAYYHGDASYFGLYPDLHSMCLKNKDNYNVLNLKLNSEDSILSLLNSNFNTLSLPHLSDLAQLQFNLKSKDTKPWFIFVDNCEQADARELNSFARILVSIPSVTVLFAASRYLQSLQLILDFTAFRYFGYHRSDIERLFPRHLELLKRLSHFKDDESKTVLEQIQTYYLGWSEHSFSGCFPFSFIHNLMRTGKLPHPLSFINDPLPITQSPSMIMTVSVLEEFLLESLKSHAISRIIAYAEGTAQLLVPYRNSPYLERLSSETDPRPLISQLGVSGYPKSEHLAKLETPKLVNIFDISGSGKTRLILEHLCNHFGFYFSGDLPEYARITEMFVQAMKEPALEANDLAKANFKMLLFHRFVLFKHIRSIFADKGSQLTPKIWLLFQLYPKQILGENIFSLHKKFFQHITISDFHDGFLDSIVAENSGFGQFSKCPIVIDQAQVLCESKRRFPVIRDGTGERSILAPLIQLALSIPSAQVIVSATVLKLQSLDDFAAAIKGAENADEVITNLGGIQTRDQIDYMLRNRFGYAHLADDPRAIDVLYDTIRGRYGFIFGVLSELAKHDNPSYDNLHEEVVSAKKKHCDSGSVGQSTSLIHQISRLDKDSDPPEQFQLFMYLENIVLWFEMFGRPAKGTPPEMALLLSRVVCRLTRLGALCETMVAIAYRNLFGMRQSIFYRIPIQPQLSCKAEWFEVPLFWRLIKAFQGRLIEAGMFFGGTIAGVHVPDYLHEICSVEWYSQLDEPACMGRMGQRQELLEFLSDTSGKQRPPGFFPYRDQGPAVVLILHFGEDKLRVPLFAHFKTKAGAKVRQGTVERLHPSRYYGCKQTANKKSLYVQETYRDEHGLFLHTLENTFQNRYLSVLISEQPEVKIYDSGDEHLIWSIPSKYMNSLYACPLSSLLALI